jgi:O-antigen/teichoic acid export membrane protein
MMIAVPLLSEYLGTKEKNELQKLTSKISKGTMAISVPLTAALIIAGPFILRLFGEYYTSAYPILLALALGQCLALLYGPAGFLLAVSGNHTALYRVIFINLILSAASLFVAAQYFGLVTLAVTSGLLLFLRAFFFSRAVKSLMGIECFAFRG